MAAVTARITARRQRSLLVWITIMSLIELGLGCDSRSSLHQRAAQQTSSSVVAAAIDKPPRPPQDYVGSLVCAECHREISEQYAAHPMGISAGSIHDVPTIEKYGESNGFVAKDGRHYFAEQTDDKFVHHEALFNDDSEMVYDQSVAMDLSIGSGRHGRSYAFRRGDRYYMSSLSWYSSSESWDLSPGYQPTRHYRFDRLLTERCLVCHIGLMTPGPALDSWDHEQPITEFIISCERCHGPAQKHVDYRRQHLEQQGPDPIVNPAKLDPIRREAVCHQCHLKPGKTLPRYGRRPVDFRPGDRMSDIWVVISDKITERQAVTHSEQMLASTCYQKSEGRFGCNSCHNPHKLPSGDTGAWFDQKCAACHTEEKSPCGLPIGDRSEKNCIGCHMPRFEMNNVPHTALTDHRIRKPAASSGQKDSSQTVHLEFDEGEPRVPEWEIRRAKSLQVRTDRRMAQNPDEMQQALSTILDLTDRLPDDPDLWETAAWISSRQGNWKPVETYARKTLELQPDRLETRELLVGSLSERGAWPDVAQECERLIQLDPGRAMYHKLLAEARWHQADLDGGLAAAEESLKFDPTQRELRARLVQAYQQLGNTQQVQLHRKVLEAMARKE